MGVIMYKYKFTVVIPIYNVEEYLEEAIESVIKQSIGFEKNIQIILVNDGSQDNSEEICLKYVKNYPKNIKYIKQKNSGVSSARNNGLKYVSGEYINFLDSDDKWESNAFEKAYKMFSTNKDVNIIGVRQKYFEAVNTYPSLDFKFNKDKVVSIYEDYDHIQLSVTSAFIRTSSIKNIRFDEEVKYSEDAKFLNEIIIINGKLGIISSSLHYYRKRLNENSAIQTKNYNKDWYLIVPIKCYKAAFSLSIKKFGFVIPYFQYYVIYDYQWRIREGIPDCINNKVKNEYVKITKELFNNIDDSIIINQKNISSEYKIKALSLKYDKDITKDLLYNHHYLYFNGHSILDLKNKNHLKLNIVNFNSDYIEIRGTVNLPLKRNDYKINVVIDNKLNIPLKLIKTDINSRKFFNKIFMSNYGFCVRIPINFNSVYFEIVYKKLYLTKMNFMCGTNSKIDCRTKNYYIYNDYIYYYNNGAIKRKKNNISNKLHFKIRHINYLIRKKEFKVIAYRMLYKLLKIFKKKEIWLMSDRPDAANDNGLCLFKYICSNNNNVKSYFVLSKNSNNYDNVKKIGNVINFNSIKYKLYFLLSDKIISSQADLWVTSPFGKKQHFYNDLYNCKFVFLQHGIIKNDLSSWLNCYEKDIKLFVTSTESEYNSIINGNYGFRKDVIKLTGLPRFDLLCNDKEKLIAIMPTWRLNLASNINRDGIRPYSKRLKNSEYFNFYNKLINDKKLLSKMDEYGYRGVFVVHPSHVENYTDFKSDKFEIVNGYANYQDIFNKASLLVTDYSSVSFDFAYIKKPIIYTQFDKFQFYKNNFYKKGYFSDELDGFGPICTNYEDTVNEIIKEIENECSLDDTYLNRINNFYKFFDNNNCKRVYEEILKIKN